MVKDKEKNKKNIEMNSSDKYSDYKFTFLERFIKYVKYDTQSDMNSKSHPSTLKQNVLLKELSKELSLIGIKSVFDEKGYVYATIPSNSPKNNSKKNVPIIGFIAHVDTNFDVSGKDVNPIIHKNYDGKDIILPKNNQVIKVKDNPELKKVIGHDLITSDGSTLLGADDKAGVSEIMDAANYIMTHKDFKHGEIKIAFTTDEEVGRGMDSFDVNKFGAKYAYTVDGENVGEVECETFNADKITIKIEGHNTHTGYAKGKMINASKIASEIVCSLPKNNLTPESTSDREGFIHVNNINGNVESAIIEIFLRDFVEAKLRTYEKMIRQKIKGVMKNYSKAKCDISVEKQYRNMKIIVDKYPQIMDYARIAMKNIGIVPSTKIIRGGTDGCNLSFMGVPTPNIFCGEHNFHSRTEWASVQEMKLSVKTILEICKVWEEKS